MWTRVFMFFASLHGICDALLLSEMGWQGFVLYGSLASFILWSSQKKCLLWTYGVFTIYPAFQHFLLEDGKSRLLYLVPGLVWPRTTIQAYFLLIHSWKPTLECCIEGAQKNMLGYSLWLAGSTLFPCFCGDYCERHPEFLDRLLLSVTIPHLLLNGCGTFMKNIFYTIK